MKTISVNAISRKYEQLHKKYEKTSMKDERFFAINNAMIFSYFSLLNGLVYDGANSQEIIRKIEKTYGMALFFYNVKKRLFKKCFGLHYNRWWKFTNLNFFCYFYFFIISRRKNNGRNGKSSTFNRR